MEENLFNDSNNHDPNGSGIWGTMGGNVGDGGFMTSPSYSVPHPSSTPTRPTQPPPPHPPPPVPGYGLASHNALPAEQFPPHDPKMGMNPYTSPTSPSIGSGSITRFATPDQEPEMHYSSIPSAHLQQHNALQPPQQGGASSYMTQTQPSYSGPSQAHPYHQQAQPTASRLNAPLPFTARSQQTHGALPASQLQPQQASQMLYGSHQNHFNDVSTVVPPGSSYTSRSQQSYGSANPQHHQPSTYSQDQGYRDNLSTHPTSAPSGGSYASRSDQAFRGPTQQIMGMQSQQAMMMPATMSGPNSASYAARSAQALYGTSQPPQPPHPQQPYDASNMMQQHHPQPHVDHQVFPQQQQRSLYEQQQLGMIHGQQPNMPHYGSGNTVGQGRLHEGPEAASVQQRLLTEATKKMQEHSYYMKQAMEQKNLSIVLERAAQMVGELGGPPHGQQQQLAPQGNNINNPGSTVNNSGPVNTGFSSKLTPKNYYELYMRVVEEISAFEEYLTRLASNNTEGTNNPIDGIIRIIDAPAVGNLSKDYSMRELYDCVQYCPRVVSRLYLQITAGSALIRSGEVGAKYVLKDLQDAVKCEQNPIRGLFLRHYLLTALKDKLPTSPLPPDHPLDHGKTGPSTDSTSDKDDEGFSTQENVETLTVKNPTSEMSEDREQGNVKDSYEFILSNFMEMNKLWVRIQHLPGEGKNKDVRKRRGRERNDLRILVGTNLVRLSQLESVTSKIYGEVILPQILEHIVIAGDPLSQAYIMDCLVQVFPDEYHIETLPILLNVCPRLRDKVNIRTILQGLMDRLANYLADEELLDESDTNEVKKTLARDSFKMFEDCVSVVYNARGPKLTSREVIRLQTALLQFSIKCYPGNMEQINSCISSCASALRQANASYDFLDGTVVEVPQDKVVIKPLDDVAVVELEKLLSIPLDSLALKILHFDDYSNLVAFLPWTHRREVALKMLKAAIDSATTTEASSLATVSEVEAMFRIIEPLIRDEHTLLSSNNIQNMTTAISSMGIHNQQNPSRNIPQYTPEQIHAIHQENAMVSKLFHLLSECSADSKIVYEMMVVAKRHILVSSDSIPNSHRLSQTLVALVYAALRLCRRISFVTKVNHESPNKVRDTVLADGDKGKASQDALNTPENENVESKPIGDSEGAPINVVTDVRPSDNTEDTSNLSEESRNIDGDVASSTFEVSASSNLVNAANTLLVNNTGVLSPSPPDIRNAISCRTLFIFIQEVIAQLAKYEPEKTVKLYLEMSLAADVFVTTFEIDNEDLIEISYEFLKQAYATYEELICDPKVQQRCLVAMAGALMALDTLTKDHYESFITKTAQFSAKITKKQDQFQLIALCAHLFYPVGSARKDSILKYSNPQRSLECLQRCLKLADACTNTNPIYVKLFVDILEQYVYFFEKQNPSVTHAYISGLVALIKEHLNSLSGNQAAAEAKTHYDEILRYIIQKKNGTDSSELFAPVTIG